MKLSESFFYTRRDDIKDEDTISGKLLVKSGMIKKVGSGLYVFMPLGLKVKQKIENIIREEMNKQGANEVLMDCIVPSEYYKKANRLDSFGKDMFRLKDRYNKDYALGPTHEEIFTLCAKEKIKSYKDMPFNIYQIGEKFRDETRPRAGLIRSREFTMKDAYSFDIDHDHTNISYNKMKEAYKNIFDRMDLNYRIVKAGVGSMGGDLSEEFQALSNIGEDTIITCTNCDFASNREVAPVKVKKVKKEKEKPLEKFATPNIKTIDDLEKYLNDSSKLVKTLVYTIDNEVYFILVKGKRSLNLDKLKALTNGKNINPSTEEKLKKVCSGSFGSLGPINTKAKILCDNEVLEMTNFITEANIDGYHYKNVNLKDFTIYKSGDLVNIEEDDICPECGSKLIFNKGIEIGNIFELGTHYAQCLDLTYLDENNKKHFVDMGCYGIGVGRVMQTVVEEHHDEKGIIWPKEIAPFDLGIILLNDAKDIADKLYLDLSTKYDIILDDRKARAGVKFNDMDLIGVPYTITIGKKISDNIVELKSRDGMINKEINLNSLEGELNKIL